MTLLGALSAETLKIKRTLALKMAVVAPLAVVLLTLFMASPVSTTPRINGRRSSRVLCRGGTHTSPN